MALSNRLMTELPPLPFIDLKAQRARIGHQIDAAIARTVGHGQFIMGPEVAELESQIAAFCGVDHVVTCANGTDALILVLMAEDIGPGDAVFVPSFTFVATAEAVAARRATPVVVDVDHCSFNMDAASLSRAVGEAKRQGLTPRMVFAVDLFGQPADYDALGAVAAEHGLVLVADAAQSFGAERGGRTVGALARYTTTSFFPAKPLGCYGDGGAIMTNDPAGAAVLKSLRTHGQGRDKYENVRIGLNSRLDTIQAAVLIEKLKAFPGEIDARNEAAFRYDGLLSDVVETPRVANGARSVWAQYTVLLPQGADRESVRTRCQEMGVPTVVYYPIPIDAQPGYRDYPRDPDGCPNAALLATRVLSVPMHPDLDQDSQSRVAEALHLALGAG